MASAIKQAVGGCQCTAPGCLLKWSLTGCNSLPLVGATIGVWTDATKATPVGTATDDGGGNYHLTGPAAGSYYVEIGWGTPDRFAAFTNTQTYTCGSTKAFALTTPATGYGCAVGCAVPVKNTLFLTDAVYGPVTLTRSGATWIGVLNAAYPGGTCAPLLSCPAATVPITFRYTGLADITLDWFESLASCPSATGPAHWTCNVAPTTDSCPPLVTWSGSRTIGAGDCFGAACIGAFARLYGAPSVPSWSLTE